MVKLRFDSAFDGLAWPGVLGLRRACAGEDWVGPMGLLGRLETALGLGGLYPSTAERAAALIPNLRELEGYWSRSFAADTWSTARRLLRDRDVLWLQGWRGQALTARLRQLARATRSALPGLPDRIQAVVIELDRRQTDIELIELTTPSLRRGPGWREVFLRLERQGVTITTVEPGGEQASGDLGGAQAGAFIPRGDGTLQLLRPHGPAEAAEEVAAWLAARTSLYRP